MVDEFRDETAVGSVVLAGTVAVHGAHAHGLCAELRRGVQAHELPRPLRNRVVVELLDGNTFHDVLRHSAVIVAVDFRAAEENEAELVSFLETNHVLRADGVGLPEILVKVLAVPTAILGSQVENAVETMRPEEPF